MIEKTSSDFLQNVIAVLQEVGEERTASFKKMARLAGLDPAKDFIGADLSGLDFRDDDLSGFNFSQADLRFADFRRANIEEAIFVGAQLQGAIGLPQSPNDPERPRGLRELKRLIASGIRPPDEVLGTIVELRFGDTAIHNIEILTEFPKLQRLSLINRAINDYSPIERMAELRNLEIDGSNIRSLREIGSPKKLQSISASFSSLSSVEGAASFENLQFLNIASTKVDDLSPLVGSGVQVLRAYRTPLKDISPLSKVQGLRLLDISGSNVVDIAAVAGMKNLNKLELSDTAVATIDRLSECRVESLDISRTQIRDLSPLRSHDHLKTIRADGNPGIGPIEIISTIKGIRDVSFDRCEIREFQIDISSLNNIESISVERNNIMSIHAEGDCPSLQFIDISFNPMREIGFAARTPNLRTIYALGIEEMELNPLRGLRKLGDLSVEEIDIDVLGEVADHGRAVRVMVSEDFYQRNKTIIEKKVSPFQIGGAFRMHNREYRSFFV